MSPTRNFVRSSMVCLLMSLTALVAAQSNRADWIQWIPLCGKCLSPSISHKSGLGTSKAVAEGKVTAADAQAWCENWEPENKDCIKQQLESEQGKVYRISANCHNGSLTSYDGTSYRYAGVWRDEDIGKGRPKFRDSSGQIVPRDHASGGLTLAAQWELLCQSSTARQASGTPRKKQR